MHYFSSFFITTLKKNEKIQRNNSLILIR